MHVKDDAAHQFIDRVYPYLQQAEVFAAEMDLAQIDPAKMFAAKQLPPGVSISGLLTEKKYSKIRGTILRSFHIDLDQYDHFHPFLINAMIGESVMAEDHAHSLDQVLWQQASKLNMRLTGLESFDKQMTIMGKISVQTSLRQLKQLARQPKKFRKEVAKMLKYYEDQDIRRLYKISKKQLQELKRALLYDRNKAMAESILALGREGNLFAAFGAGHLAGEKGVLRYLKHGGRKIEPVII